MTLTTIEYGALASSATLNSNFQDLQSKITTLSALITSQTSSFSASVATLNTNVTNLLACRNSFIPTGTIIAYQSSTIPTGFLLCDGSEILISQYDDLYDVIGTTYGQTDSTSFCLPNMQNRTLFGSSTANQTGSYLSAAIPNITGSFSSTSGPISATGALNVTSSVSTHAYGSGSGENFAHTVNFDASRSSNIYSNSATTVQPPALVTIFIIKY